EAELKVMRYIWESEKVLIPREITKSMEQKYEWKDTTIFTVLKRLLKKRVFRSGENR
ncbi:BlaI/MecI/CopY family transcriptional regulator, partial [Clostridioides difficile]